MNYSLHLFGRLCVLLFVIFMMSACGDDNALVGSEIVGADEINVKFRDDVIIKAKTVSVDSLLGFGTQQRRISGTVIRFDQLLLGDYDDPNFGKVQAKINTNVRFAGVLPNFKGVSVIDSLVLSLTIHNNDKVLGVNAPMQFEVFAIDEHLNNNTLYWTNDEIELRMPSLANETKQVLYDSAVIYDPLVDTLVRTVPQLRLRLDNTLGMSLIDTMIKSDSLLATILPGLMIRSEQGANVMHQFDLSRSSLKLYYTNTENDTLVSHKVYAYVLGSTYFNSIKQEKEGSLAEAFLLDESLGDSLLYMEGLSGYDIEVDLSDVLNYKDSILINYAELEFVIATSLLDTIKFPLLEKLIAKKYNEENELVYSEDVVNAEFQNGLARIFGGEAYIDFDDDLNKIIKVKTNVTLFLKDVLNEEQDAKLRLLAFNAKENVGRSIIYGPKHSKYPMKLNLTYSVPK